MVGRLVWCRLHVEILLGMGLIGLWVVLGGKE